MLTDELHNAYFIQRTQPQARLFNGKPFFGLLYPWPSILWLNQEAVFAAYQASIEHTYDVRHFFASLMHYLLFYK